MITTNTPQQVQLSDADTQFVQLVNNMITAFGQIPYTVPQQLIVEIIKNSARFFYKTAYKATEKQWYRLLKGDIKEFYELTKQTGQVGDRFSKYIKLTPNIRVIQNVYQSNDTQMPTSQEMLDSIQLLQRSSPYGMSIMGINNSLYITEACCKMVEYQNFQSIFGTCINFNYNSLTSTLTINSDVQVFPKGAQGQEISSSLIIETLVDVPIQVLYNDDLFQRHVIARTKEQLKRILGGHTIELPGGVTLNPDEICNNIEDANTVEEILKNAGGIGDIIMFR